MSKRLRIHAMQLATWFIPLLLILLAPSVLTGIYDRSWLPAGPRDPALRWVIGDSWAITDSGRVFQYERTLLDWPYYIEVGPWSELRLGESEGIRTWGRDGENIIIETRGGIRVGGNLSTNLGMPGLNDPVLALGHVRVCDPEDSPFVETNYALSTNQIAFYDWSVKRWIVVALREQVVSPPVSLGCQLLFTNASGLHYVRITGLGEAEAEPFPLEEGNLMLPEIGGAVDLRASGQEAWMLSEDGRVYEIESRGTGESPIQLKELPAAPPQVSNPRLVAGTAGWMFSPTDEYIDLWLIGDDGVHWYNRSLQRWESFHIPHSETLRALSSLTTNSETVGTDVTRLAIVNGAVYRQRPIVSTRFFWLLFIGCPVSLLTGTGFIIIRSLVQRRRPVG